MPIYEYQCKKCDEIFEVLQDFDDEPLERCNDIFKISKDFDENVRDKPVNCSGKGKLEKIISLSAFHLKGSGWYETDYGKKKVSEEKQLTNKSNSDTQNETVSNSYGQSSTNQTDSGSKEVYDSIKSDTKKAKVGAKKS